MKTKNKSRIMKDDVNNNFAVIYARYSSRAQDAQTVEGQLRANKLFAEREGLTIIGEYVDEGKSGRTDNRPEFLRMINDAKTRKFGYIIVLSIDRFSRALKDHANYEVILRGCGVKILSATEPIGNSDEAFFYKGMLAIASEDFSRRLSKRLKYAFDDTLERDSAWGGKPLLGYKVENKKYVIDEQTAPAVRYLFEQIVEEKPLKEIYQELNEKGYRTSKGKPFTINSFQNALRNPRYCGKYTHEGVEYPNRFPAIIPEDLFYRAQNVLARKKYMNGAGNAKDTYLLSGKVVCGHCGKRMQGISGTSNNEDKHYYYVCGGRSRFKSCTKANEHRDALETLVVTATVKMLFFGNMDIVAERASAEFSKRLNTQENNSLKKELKAIDNEFDNLTSTLMKTTSPSVIANINARFDALEIRKSNVHCKMEQFHIASSMPHRKSEVLRLLKQFKVGDVNDPKFRKRVINKFVNVVYVYDERIQIFFNLITNEKVEFRDLPHSRNSTGTAQDSSIVQVSHSLVHHRKKPKRVRLGFFNEIFPLSEK